MPCTAPAEDPDRSCGVLAWDGRAFPLHPPGFREVAWSWRTRSPIAAWTAAYRARKDCLVALLRRNAKIEMLRRVPLLHRCSRRDLERVAALAEERDLQAGVELTREGDPGREFFIVIDGRVEVRRHKRKIDEIGPGGFFGEIALLTGTPRNATVTTATPTRVLVLQNPQFNSLLQHNGSMAVKVMHALAERVPPATTN